MDNCGIFEKFDVKSCLIKEYEYWYLLIRRRQSYLGSCVVILKRHAFPVSQLTIDELQESQQIIKETEISLIKSFQADFTQQATIMFVDQHVHCLSFQDTKTK